MSLLQAFGIEGADYGPIIKWSRDNFGAPDTNNPHRIRRQGMAERVRYYRDGYADDVSAMVDLVFENTKVKEQRKKLIKFAMGNNPTRHVTEEVANLYDRPAKRIFEDQGAQDRWQAFELTAEHHEVAQEAHRLTFLCNEVLQWFEWSKVDDQPSWRIITPDAFDVIPDPRDPLRPAGFIIDWAPVSIVEGSDRDRLCHRVLWDDRVFVELDKDWRSIRVEKHGYGRIPGLLLHRRKPVDRILDSTSGEDIISAHRAVVLLNLLMVRLAKAQGEQQPVLRGHLARVVKGQALDGETPLALPPEVFAEMLNTKTDPDHYLKQVRHFIGGVANNYGLSYEQFTYSAKATESSQKKLTELREEQRLRATRREKLTVALVSDMHEVRDMAGYDVTKHRTDFAEQLIPMDADKEMKLLDDKMRKGLDNPVAWLLRKNPDLNAKQAEALVKENLTVWGWLVELSRILNASQDDGTGPDRGRSPEENGAHRGPEPPDDPGARLMRNEQDDDSKAQAA